jgi:hypothetical protein
MSIVEKAVEVDGDKLMQFVFRAVDEVGATLNAALVVMGDKLGLYRALAGAGPLTAAELAERTGTAERYVREWLNAQAAGGFVAYDPRSGRYTLPPEQTVALTDTDSPAYLPGLFQIALGSVIDSPRIVEKARSGDGFGWHEHGHDVAYYAFSTLLCTPASLSQAVGLALGEQAGEARIRDVVQTGGFSRFHRVTETPFNLVFEAKP